MSKVLSAFLIQLATALEEEKGGEAGEGGEGGGGWRCQVHYTHVDVVAQPDAFVFRLLLLPHHSAIPPALALHVAIRALVSPHPPFALTLHRFKRWLGAHLFSPLFSDEVADLLACAWWQSGSPRSLTNPTCLLTALLRWVAAQPFARSPVVVQTDDGSDKLALLDRAQAGYARHPRPLYIVTEGGEVEVGGALTADSLRRVQAYAAASAGVIERAMEAGEEAVGRWMSVFATDLSQWDALLHLRPEVLSPHHRQMALHREAGAADDEEEKGVKEVRRGYKAPIDEEKAAVEPMYGVDVLRELVQRLHAQLGAYVDVGADYYGGQVVGLRVREGSGGGKWEVKGSGYKRVEKWGDGEVRLNVEEMVDDVRLIGHGITDRIQLQGRLASPS